MSEKSAVLLTGKQLDILNALTEPLTAKGLSRRIKSNESNVRQLTRRLWNNDFVSIQEKEDINYSNKIKFYVITERGKRLKEVFNELQ